MQTNKNTDRKVSGLMGLIDFFRTKKPALVEQSVDTSQSQALKNHSFISGVSHINIGVPDLDRAIAFYQSFLGALPLRVFPNFKNIGFSKSAGFVDNPEDVEVSIAFLDIPNTYLTLELMEYRRPVAQFAVEPRNVNDVCGVQHIALRVNDIEAAFNNAKQESGVRLISANPAYRPFTISPTAPEEFRFFDARDEANSQLKAQVAQSIGKIRYFYCVDPYGVQWEFEQGNDGIGT